MDKPSPRVKQTIKREATGMKFLVKKAKILDRVDQKKMTPGRYGKMKEFINKLARLKIESTELGLWATYQELNKAEKQVGWEVAQKWDRAERERKKK